MSEFFKTLMGRTFFDKNVPELVKALQKIGKELERLNNNLEKDKKEDE